MAAKQYDQAIDIYTKAIDSQSFDGLDLGKLYFARGIALQAKGDCNHAMVDYDQALSRLPENGDLRYNRSVCYNNLNQPDKAVVDLNEAIRINPDSVTYRVARCTILFNKRDFAAALPDCEMALRSTPDDKNMLAAVAQSAEQLADKAKAAAAYRHLHELEPNNKTAIDGLKRVGG